MRLPSTITFIVLAATAAACSAPSATTAPSAPGGTPTPASTPAGTSVKPATPAPTIGLSPSGRIAFTQGPPDGSAAVLLIANPDGSGVRRISLEDPPELFSFPVWSPDGTRILVSHTHRLDGSGACCLPFRPAVVNADGSGFRLIPMVDAPPDADCSVWSPDQTRLLCGLGGTKPGVFSVAASDGSHPIRLTTSPYGTADQGAKELPTALSPDGRRFLFIRFKPGATESEVQAALFVENVDGSGQQQITPFGYMFPHDDQAWASWSPDGRTIISTTSQGDLFTVRPDGTGKTLIPLKTTTAHFAFDPGWSPDGSLIVFAMYTNGTVHLDGSTDDNAEESLYTAQPDGSNLVQITHDSDLDHSPDWGPRP
jgi:Tol biopolymer transport system component